MKRKRIQNLITAADSGLVRASSWAHRTFDNFTALQSAGVVKEKPDAPEWLTIQNRDDGEPEILIYGMITQYPFFDDDVSASKIYKDLAAINAPRIHVRINSEGGSIFEAVAIYNLLIEKNAEIVVHIDGIAASSAGWLAMAGNVVEMGVESRLMIHQATTFTYGNADDHEESAKLLTSLENSIVKIFAARTGLDEKEIRDMLEAETYLTAEEAVEKGFADKLVELAAPTAPPEPGNRSDPPAAPPKKSPANAENNAQRISVAEARQRLRERQH